MVGQRPGGGRPYGIDRSEGIFDGGADLVRVEVGLYQLEVESEMQLVGPDVLGEASVVVHPDLADGDHIAVLVEHLADLAVVLVHALVVETWVLIGDVQHRGFGVLDIGEARRLGHAMGDIEPEAVNATVQPEPQGLGEVVKHFRVVPVDIWLFRGEQMQVPLAGRAIGLGHPGPGRTAEHRGPIVRWQFAVDALAVAEDVTRAGLTAGFGGEGLDEPAVF